MPSFWRTARNLAGLVAILAVAPASAHATTITLGPPVPGPSGDFLDCEINHCTGFTIAQNELPDQGVVDVAPASGLITSWRVAGSGVLTLRALRPVGGGRWIGDGTGPTASDLAGGVNAANLPIRAGDLIGVDLAATPTSQIGFTFITPAVGEALTWEPRLVDDGTAFPPVFNESSRRLLLDATVLLAPVVSSVSPASGSTTGGNAVKIGGNFLDGATSVTFGSTPASSFSVDSSNQITAIAPASAASTVDVRVTGPGGSSEVTSADKYTFTAPAASTAPSTSTTAAATTAPVTTTNSAPKTLIQGAPDLGPASPAVTGFGESAAKWRRGGSLPHISSAGAPVGTTFSFSLNEQATVTFTFTHSVPGRRAHGSCVAPSPGNAHKPQCKRTVLVGSFGASGSTGLHKVRFQGRLSSAKALKPGAYAVSITARDAHGLKAVSRSLSFTIVS